MKLDVCPQRFWLGRLGLALLVGLHCKVIETTQTLGRQETALQLATVCTSTIAVYRMLSGIFGSQIMSLLLNERLTDALQAGQTQDQGLTGSNKRRKIGDKVKREGGTKGKNQQPSVDRWWRTSCRPACTYLLGWLSICNI